MFGTEIVCYLFLGGAGAGACFVLAVMGLLVPRERLGVRQVDGLDGHVRTALLVPRVYRALFTPPFVCAVLALTLGMAFLLADLGRSDRILLLLTQPSLSHIVVGAYALVISVVLASVLALAWGGVFRRMAPLVVALQVLVLAGAAVVMAYTGLLLQSMRAVALWHSPWLPALFVLSSVSCGFALVVGAAQFSEAAGAFASVLSRSALADAGVIVAEALAAVALLATVAHAAQAGGANGTTVAAAESVRQLAAACKRPCSGAGS